MSNIQNNHSSSFDGPGSHKPVMLSEVLLALAPAFNGTIVDGTFGAGGYSRALLEAGAQVIGIDRDPNVQEFADKLGVEYGNRFEFVRGRFSALDSLIEKTGREDIGGVVLDIGVSSMQLDEAARGFSFMRDGPLDMGMGDNKTSAAELVNGMDMRELSDLIFTFGEEKRARRIAQAIVEARIQNPIETTLELAEIIEKAVGRKPGGNHPATKSFQALRMAVNQEMGELVQGLFAAERLLSHGGWLVVVTFHSLEDRIVKRFFDAKKSAGTVSRHMPQA
ncbi:MAG: 16S rRNA (cytosine(1402)-N(4))-methyltransferase RsmH, partial [Devosiaceae bacterium]|nr:16S rRNA (cytosine(1402)-N(4))-methyltransferase RsmH [Devosiaceae bacterium]